MADHRWRIGVPRARLKVYGGCFQSEAGFFGELSPRRLSWLFPRFDAASGYLDSSFRVLVGVFEYEQFGWFA